MTAFISAKYSYKDVNFHCALFYLLYSILYFALLASELKQCIIVYSMFIISIVLNEYKKYL